MEVSKKIKLIVAGMALLCSWTTASAKLVINELMQSNIDCVYADNEFPDSWVEVYNAGDEVVSLNGYGIGSSSKFSKAYIMHTDLTVAPKGYALIYCDKEGEGIHADFRLESTKKGEIYLFAPDGTLSDSVNYPAMPAPNVAYGMTSDGSEWGFMPVATPAQPNGAVVTDRLLPEPEFSLEGGLMSEETTVTISIPEGCEDDVMLCITTDGCEPTEKDAVGERSLTLTLEQSVAVRAKLISPTALSRNSTVHSYIFHPRATDMMVVSIVMNPEYLYDEDMGILVGELDNNPNWGYDWRRPMNIEIFGGGNHHRLVNQLGETRVKGNWSRQFEQKSLAMYANKRFGQKRFDTSEVWPDKPHVVESQSFELRNSGNDFSRAHVRDALAQRLIGHNSPYADWSAYTPAICYINGEYKGIYDVRERSNEDFIAANYDGLEDIDMVENWWAVQAGSIDSMLEFMELFMRDDVTFEKLATVMDIDNFLDLFAVSMFGANTDFPDNNIVCWKPTAAGSKWRWVLKDIDHFGMKFVEGGFENDYFTFITDKAAENGLIKLFSLFFRLQEARDLFIDRMAVYMGDMLQPRYISEQVDAMRDEFVSEYLYHCQVYMPVWWSNYYYEDWPAEIEYIKSFSEQRQAYLYGRIQEYFSLEPAYTLKIDTGGRRVVFNGLTLSQPEFDGCYYNGRDLMLVGPEDSVWSIDVKNTDGETTHTVSDTPSVELTLSDASSVVIRLSDAAGVGSVADSSTRIDSAVECNGLELRMRDGVDGVARVYGVDGRLCGELNGSKSLRLGSAGVYVVRSVFGTGETITEKVVCR